MASRGPGDVSLVDASLVVACLQLNHLNFLNVRKQPAVGDNMEEDVSSIPYHLSF